MLRKFLLFVLIYNGFLESAHGYIDPGLIGSLYQSLYIIFMGVIGFLIFKPWDYLKSLFSKPLEKKEDSKSKSKDSISSDE